MAVVDLSCASLDLAQIAEHPGLVAVFVDDAPSGLVSRLDRKMRGALRRAVASKAWEGIKPGGSMLLAHPAGLAAQAVLMIHLPRKCSDDLARKAGAEIAKNLGAEGAVVAARGMKPLSALIEGVALRAYHWSMQSKTPDAPGAVLFDQADVERAQPAFELAKARAQAVHFTRDLVNEPANVLTTTEFADRLIALKALGLEVEVLEEPAMKKLGMHALLGVGEGSETPSKLVIMRWPGSGEAAKSAPLALVGKGVVFDTGGISIKPAGGMEEMTSDMGGAAVVSGVMQLIATRKSSAHVVGVVGLVENMPDGRAQRPGDVVRSMKGDTIEVINTDAEGRLVLADALWYTQERYKPAAVIDLATLTGAIMVALGYEKAGVFSNDDALCNALLAAASDEGEGAWRMPLDPAYDALIDTRMADMKNTGGRWGGSITAAQFLQRFVAEGTPWIHLDIAGVTLPAGATTLSPKGPSGWGVRTLDALIRARFEGKE